MRSAIIIISAASLFAPLLYSALRDFRAMEIPNWVSALIAGGFMVYAAVHWNDLDILMHLIIAGTLFVITYIFWVKGWLGGGDVKLLTAVGLWLGPAHSMQFIVLLAVASSLLSILLIVVRHLMRDKDVARFSSSLRRVTQIARTGACPYAIPICLAAFATLPKLFL